MMSVRQEIAELLKALPAEAAQAIAVEWFYKEDDSLVALKKALEECRKKLEQDLEDLAYVEYLKKEGVIGFNALETGRFCTQSLDELKAEVLAKRGHPAASSKH